MLAIDKTRHTYRRLAVHLSMCIDREGKPMARFLLFLCTMITSLCLMPGLPSAHAQQAQPAPRSDSQEVKTEDHSPKLPVQGKGPESEAIVKLSSEVVTLNVTVTDKQHNLVTGLESQHFEVYENNVMQ